MKAKTFKLFIFLAGIVILFTAGCKKDISPKTQTKSAPTGLDLKINRMIERFKTDMKSNLKDGEEISIDSLVWYIEASLNETYARADSSTNHIWTDSSFVDIPVTGNNTVLLSSMNDAYSHLVDYLSDHYRAISGDKSLIFVEIDIMSIQTDKLTLRMKDYIVDKPVQPAPFNWTFGPSDYWYWGEEKGKCGSYSGNTGKDASTQLTAYANGPLVVPPGTFYIDITNTGYIFPPNVPTSGNPFGFADYLLFWCSGTGPEVDQCLSPDAMNYYLNNLKIIGSMYQPYGKCIIQYLVGWTVTVGSPWDHLHYTQITYGIPVSAIGPPETLQD